MLRSPGFEAFASDLFVKTLEHPFNRVLHVCQAGNVPFGSGFIGTTKAIAQKEGVFGFYKGILVTASKVALTSFIRSGGLVSIRNWLVLRGFPTFIDSCFTNKYLYTILTTAILQPLESIQIILTAELPYHDNAFHYTGALDVLQQHGFISLYSTFFLNILSTFWYRFGFFKLHNVLTSLPMFHNTNSMFLSFLVASLSSLGTTFAIYPLIVVKTNMLYSQADMINVIKTIYTNQGLIGFYAGYGSYVVKYFFNVAVQIIVSQIFK